MDKRPAILEKAQLRMAKAQQAAERQHIREIAHVIAHMFDDAGTVFFLMKEGNENYLGIATLKLTTIQH
jgi:hypothetical protein